jgi:double-strand break repair protein MRE11
LDSIFNKINYEDPNINVAIPVFSIHGNHDEPAGHEFYAALDVLQQTGLINYFGRMNKNDNVEIKPLLLQKGRTKLAIFGMSHLRDERLFRNFRKGNVKFFRPGQQRDEWFNLMVVHQNHHSRTPTGYLPESFLPNFLDLVVWGHEHDCEIDPRYVEEQDFHVMQPGSSIATSLSKGETIPKHVCIVKVKGRNFVSEKIPLKTVRPFIFKEIVLADEPELRNVWKKTNNRTEISRHLKNVIGEMVDQAGREWLSQQTQEDLAAMQDPNPPRPLVRLRVDYAAPEGGRFDIENSQRITSDFMNKIANHNDVIVFHIKKRAAKRHANDIDVPEQYLGGNTVEDEDDGLNLDGAQMGKLVKEFLDAQSLTVLPQNSFGDAVSQFVDKDDKNAMEYFVKNSLKQHVQHMMGEQGDFENVELLRGAMEEYRLEREALFADTAKGRSTAADAASRLASRLNPKPDDYDSDAFGPWEENAEAIMDSESDMEMLMDIPATKAGAKSTSTRGRGRGRGGKTATTSSRTAAAKKTNPSRGSARNKTPVPVEEDEEEENESDVDMQLISEPDEDSQSQSLFVSSRKTTASSRAPASTRGRSAAKPAASRATKASNTSMRQGTLDFASQASALRTSPRHARATAKKPPVIDISDDDIEDESDDAFEELPPKKTGRRR